MPATWLEHGKFNFGGGNGSKNLALAFGDSGSQILELVAEQSSQVSIHSESGVNESGGKGAARIVAHYYTEAVSTGQLQRHFGYQQFAGVKG
jgi:hypothetical protein